MSSIFEALRLSTPTVIPRRIRLQWLLFCNDEWDILPCDLQSRYQQRQSAPEDQQITNGTHGETRVVLPGRKIGQCWNYTVKFHWLTPNLNANNGDPSSNAGYSEIIWAEHPWHHNRGRRQSLAPIFQDIRRSQVMVPRGTMFVPRSGRIHGHPHPSTLQSDHNAFSDFFCYPNSDCGRLKICERCPPWSTLNFQRYSLRHMTGDDVSRATKGIRHVVMVSRSPM